ncbi:hypothetical protein GH714_038461 [Hevea brasiliensis]|uniref:Mechanosensitive ion channel protein n=1 Tax=Hevea brasiliensis TaxID=3981 RepID=A0A6A6KFS7_HEVBR|nr:hypothetical protein GH714_038461 [Hevea brasiliensis]
MSEGTNDVNIDVSDQSNGSPGITKVDEKHEMMENTLIFIESTAFVCITGLLIATLIVDRLRDTRIWDFEMWKWCCLILAVLCGRLIGYLFTEAQVKLIWKICSRRPWIERAIYFAYGVKKSIIVFIWLGLVFLAWALLFDSGVKRSKDVRKILNDVTRGLAGCLIGIAIWLVKTLLVKLVASFHVKTLFERIKEANCNRKILEAVSNKKKDSEEDTSELLNAIRVKKLPRLCCGENGRIKIEDEEGAKKAANEIFKELVVPNDQKLYGIIELISSLLFPSTCGVRLMTLVKCCCLQVKVYKDYESVNSALKYRKTAVDELNKLASVVVIFVIVIVWLLFMEFLTTKIVVFMTSQLLLVVFMFGNTVKTVFEAIIFVFLMHPFDVGDRCLIDGIQASSKS